MQKTNDINEILNIFCTRMCHDMLNPVGALQIAVDNFIFENSTTNTNPLSQSINSLINTLDLLRKSYGYINIFQTQQELLKIIVNVFGERVKFCNEINKIWFQDLLKLFVWLKYKVLTESAIDIKQADCKSLIIEVHNVYISDEELKLVKNDECEINAYVIYLLLFVQSLTKEKHLNMKYDNIKHHLSIKIIHD